MSPVERIRYNRKCGYRAVSDLELWANDIVVVGEFKDLENRMGGCLSLATFAFDRSDCLNILRKLEPTMRILSIDYMIISADLIQPTKGVTDGVVGLVTNRDYSDLHEQMIRGRDIPPKLAQAIRHLDASKDALWQRFVPLYVIGYELVPFLLEQAGDRVEDPTCLFVIDLRP